MTEKVYAAIMVAVASITAFILGQWAKHRFVKKADFVDSTGRPLFQYRQDCNLLQQACVRQNCAKFDELRSGQKEVWKTIDGMKSEMGKQAGAMERIDQKLADLITAVRNGRT